MKKAVILLAEGFEEIEAIVPIDLLRRGGINVTVAGLHGETVTSSHGIRIQTDVVFSDYTQFTDYDAVILPGGMPGASNLADSWEVNELIIRMFNEGKLVAAICAAPAVVLGKLGILAGRNAVCYPGAESFAPECSFGNQPCVVDGNLITARGPGYAPDFGLALLQALTDADKVSEVQKAALFG